jgi:adenylosuccinate lyase
LDGRYANSAAPFKDYFSEFALIKYRTKIEIEWLKFLAKRNMIKNSKGAILNLTEEDFSNSYYIMYMIRLIGYYLHKVYY